MFDCRLIICDMIPVEDDMNNQRPILIVTFCILTFFHALGCKAPKYSEGLYAELQTNKGLIVLRLEFEKTPATVMNFVGLTEGTIENDVFPLETPYFDGTVFHRVVPGHVIQAGAPAGGKAQSPGYTIPNEIHSDLGHGRAGMLGMANSGPHTNGSQFYITLGDRSYLDGDYTVFGEVVEGMDVVEAVVQGDTVEKVSIVRVGRQARAFRVDTASFQSAVEKLKKQVEDRQARRREEEWAHIESTWPDLAPAGEGIFSQILDEGTGSPSVPGTKLRIQYSGQKLLGDGFNSSAEAGLPKGDGPAEEFDYVAGETRLNPGLDRIISQMKKGERRLVVLLPEAAYGDSGFYARQVPGQPRFVISPGTALVYEIEILDPGN
jgi:cyclophilin family peptidyl-prolyl cis-trans isomerase